MIFRNLNSLLYFLLNSFYTYKELDNNVLAKEFYETFWDLIKQPFINTEN